MTNRTRQDTTRCCSLLECCRRLTRSPSERPRFSDIPAETTRYAHCFSLSSRHYASRFRRWWLRQILLVLQSQGADISRCRKRWRREPNKDTNLFIEGQGCFLVVKVHASHTSCQGEAEAEAAAELPQNLQYCSLHCILTGPKTEWLYQLRIFAYASVEDHHYTRHRDSAICL